MLGCSLIIWLNHFQFGTIRKSIQNPLRFNTAAGINHPVLKDLGEQIANDPLPAGKEPESYQSKIAVVNINAQPTVALNSAQQTSVLQERKTGNFGLCKTAAPFATVRNIPRRVTSSIRVQPEPGYSVEFWGKVGFAPVPPFFMNTHDPVNQDVFISGSVHRATEPWDSYIWTLFVNILEKAGPGTTVVDVGANIGYFSLLAASMGQRVISFEPMNRNVAKFQASIDRNDFQERITLFQNAISYDSSNQVKLSATHHTNQGNGRIEIITPSKETKEGVYGQDYVDTITIDDIINEDVLLMKIDVEGFEGAVLNGAKKLLCWHVVKFITIEFSTETRESKDCPALGLLQLLEAVGYVISDIVPDAPRLSPTLLDRFPPNILFRLLDTSQPPGHRLGPLSACQM
uniref:Methyltransferase FkbM domain-containing protein n=1 Tax=Cryptomonas curvata TaxID=233186 RepID=A0A7S0MHW8_9CRYP